VNGTDRKHSCQADVQYNARNGSTEGTRAKSSSGPKRIVGKPRIVLQEPHSAIILAMLQASFVDRGKRATLLVLIFLAPVLAHGAELPDGPGKSVVEKVCGDCHGAEVYAGKHRDKQQWNATIDRMIRHGATATDAQFDQIVDYLVRNFGPDESKIESTTAHRGQ
jgi:cytochrome c5